MAAVASPTTPLLLRIGSRIAEIRRLKGYTQEDLANLYGCSPRYVQLVEQGHKNMSVSVLEGFAGALDVAIESLFVPPKSLKKTPGRPPKKK